MNVIEKSISILLGSSGLDVELTKLALYYTIATWKIPHLDKFPILRFCGPPGTGKTSALCILRNWCYNPRLITGKSISTAAMRDELNAAELGTALIEEADEASEPVDCEQLFAARFSRTTGQLVVKTKTLNGESWEQVQVGTYGATILHYRRAFFDQATQSRSLTVNTRFRDKQYTTPLDEEVKALTSRLSSLGDCIDLADVADLGSGRVHDVWAPVLAVARLIRDDDWIHWATQQMEAELQDLKDGHAYELSGLILAQILKSLTKENDNRIECRRLTVQDDIIEPIRKHEQVKLTPFQASRQLKELGFNLQRTGGQNKFTPTLESLKRAASKIGYQDTLLQ
jgi:DNA polymerase III delta prime subunit